MAEMLKVRTAQHALRDHRLVYAILAAALFCTSIGEYSLSHDMWDLYFGAALSLLFFAMLWASIEFALPVFIGKELYAGDRGLRIRISDQGIWFAGLKSMIPWRLITDAKIEARGHGNDTDMFLIITTVEPLDGYGDAVAPGVPLKQSKKSFWPRANREAEKVMPRTEFLHNVAALDRPIKEIEEALMSFRRAK